MTSYPTFPHFIQLNLAHKDLIRATVDLFPPYSDFNFVSMFTWDTDEKIGVAELNDNLVVRFTDYENGEVFLSLLGTQRLAETLDALTDYCLEAGITTELQLVPHSVVKAMSEHLRERYEVTEDRDDHDYIMSTSAVADGKIATNKRRSYSRFMRLYGDRVHCATVDIHSAEGKHQIQTVVDTWGSAKALSSDNEKELVAIERCLRHSHDLDISAYGAFVSGELIAFIIFEIASQSTAMLHFGKSDHGLPGGFDFMKIEMAKYLVAHDVEFMNMEQDLGIEGLRVDKNAFRPVELLQKYTVKRI